MEFSEAAATTSIANDSESVLPVLPLEIIHEIFLKLDAKTLLKIRCVCKYWLSVISSPQFIKTHLNISTKNQYFLHHRLLLSGLIQDSITFHSCSLYKTMYEESPHIAVELDFPCKKPFGNYMVVGSCDGLLCISAGPENLLLWNPSIRKFKRMPFSGTNANDDSSTLAYGFCYNECKDDYKVVEIVGSRRENRFGEFEDLNDVRIYSLRSNSWQRIHENFPGVFFRKHAKFVNGRLHWFATRIMDNIFSRFVASLNLEDDTYEEVALPDLDDGDVGELGTLGGNLCVSCDYNRVHMDVWVMLEYGLVDSWTRVVSVPYFNFVEHRICPIFISQNYKILLANGSSLLLYNSTQNVLRHPQIQVHSGFGVLFSVYIESLVWPNFAEEV